MKKAGSYEIKRSLVNSEKNLMFDIK